MAATIYRCAWPTATYKSAEFWGFQREPDGIAVMMKLTGDGLFGDNLWLKLGVVVNGNGFQDIRVIDHNALLVPPFAVYKSLANLTAQLAKEYANRQAANPPASQPMAGAICIMNGADIDLVFAYRWGDAAWRQSEVKAGQSELYWWQYETSEHASPRFDIRYDDSLAAGYTEQAYWLERTATSLPATCNQASRYRFSVEGQKVLLHKVKLGS